MIVVKVYTCISACDSLPGK